MILREVEALDYFRRQTVFIGCLANDLVATREVGYGQNNNDGKWPSIENQLNIFAVITLQCFRILS